MRCERCGKELTNRVIRINGITVCENCARLMGWDGILKDPTDLIGNPFAPLDEIASTLMKMNELDFGNSTLTCPKCGMSLREFENSGRVGCIECYNTFNENIIREMFKQQGNSEYAGRLPNRPSDADVTSQEISKPENSSKISAGKTEEQDKDISSSDGKEQINNESAPKAEKKEEKGSLTVEKLKKADLGMLSDDDLAKGIKLAAEAEEYILASKLRDELKGRKDGNNNG